MRIFLFCDLKKIGKKFKKKLDFAYFIKISELDNFLQRIKGNNFLVDDLTCSIFYKNIIRRNNNILKHTDPIYFLKSQKNKVEINNTKKIHEYDGAALTKFLFGYKIILKKQRLLKLQHKKNF